MAIGRLDPMLGPVSYIGMTSVTSDLLQNMDFRLIQTTRRAAATKKNVS